MPTIRPSADLRNKYSDISDFCHKYNEPVFITKNGKGDLAVLSIAAYEALCGKAELYRLLDEGLEAEVKDDLHAVAASFEEIRKESTQ